MILSGILWFTKVESRRIVGKTSSKHRHIKRRCALYWIDKKQEQRHIGQKFRIERHKGWKLQALDGDFMLALSIYSFTTSSCFCHFTKLSLKDKENDYAPFSDIEQRLDGTKMQKLDDSLPWPNSPLSFHGGSDRTGKHQECRVQCGQ